MFARVLEVMPKMEKKDELIRTVRQEILPMLKKQPGFLEIVPLVPEIAGERWIAVTLWSDKHQAERYVSEVYPKVEKIVKPFLAAPVVFRTFTVETSISEHLVNAIMAVA